MSDCPYFDSSHSMADLHYVCKAGTHPQKISVNTPALRINISVAGVIRSRMEKKLRRRKNRNVASPGKPGFKEGVRILSTQAWLFFVATKASL